MDSGRFPRTLALYTTVYPGAERFLGDFFASLQSQTDQDFDLWVGLDQIDVPAVVAAMGTDPGAIWVQGIPGGSPAQVRQLALSKIVTRCDGVVLVDSDDILHPSRVAAAREALKRADVAACALRLVDAEGEDMGETFGPSAGLRADDVLPKYNVFGLSNTAYRVDALQECLPIPDTVVAVDWLLATRAWLCGCTMSFDVEPRMFYRQHLSNILRVLPPFSEEQVGRETRMARDHFRSILSELSPSTRRDRLTQVMKVAEEVEQFYVHVVQNPELLSDYVESLELVDLPRVWWASVANPALRMMWAVEEEG
ncbi:MAG: hypothetical protein GX604_09555 [Actinobacteria bacterium]|nr:hypothetical protein [Actinomycetota bacterium]